MTASNCQHKYVWTWTSLVDFSVVIPWIHDSPAREKNAAIDTRIHDGLEMQYVLRLGA